LLLAHFFLCNLPKALNIDILHFYLRDNLPLLPQEWEL
jgi:hypothetical protein